MDSAATRKEVQGFDPRKIYEKDGFNVGEGELVVGGSGKQVLGRVAACVLWPLNDDGAPVFDGVTVIAPPLLVWDVSDDDILEMIVQGFNDLRYDQVGPEERAAIQERLTVYRCERLEVREVLKAIEMAGESQLLLVPRASKYRDPSVVIASPVGRTAVVFPEDQWFPHLGYLVTKAIEIAQKSGSFLVFSAVESPPTWESSQKILTDVNGLYPCFLHYVGDDAPGELVLKNAARWVGLAPRPPDGHAPSPA